jgi:hypothetical protein
MKLQDDYSAEEVRALARRSKDVNQGWRFLSVAAGGVVQESRAA